MLFKETKKLLIIIITIMINSGGSRNIDRTRDLNLIKLIEKNIIMGKYKSGVKSQKIELLFATRF